MLERPLVFLSAGRRILSSFNALISSFWVCTRADCSLLQPLVDEGSCSELALNKLYASELLGGDRLWEFELGQRIKKNKERNGVGEAERNKGRQ